MPWPSFVRFDENSISERVLNAILSSSNLRRIYINSGWDEMNNDQKILDKRFSFPYSISWLKIEDLAVLHICFSMDMWTMYLGEINKIWNPSCTCRVTWLMILRFSPTDIRFHDRWNIMHSPNHPRDFACLL